MTNPADSSRLDAAPSTPTSNAQAHTKRATSKYKAIGVVVALATLGGGFWTATVYDTADQTAVVHMEATRTGGPHLPGLPGHPIRKILKKLTHPHFLDYKVPSAGTAVTP
jgi:hypothetical protein